jgi:hypothetical protein
MQTSSGKVHQDASNERTAVGTEMGWHPRSTLAIRCDSLPMSIVEAAALPLSAAAQCLDGTSILYS